MRKLILLLLALIFIISLIVWLKKIESKYSTENVNEKVETKPKPLESPTPNILPDNKESTKPLEEKKKPEEIQGGFNFSPVDKEKWYPKLKSDLLAFETKSTKVSIEAAPTDRFGENKKILLVSYLRKDGSRSSFKALFDTKSGKLIRTWDQTQFEPSRKKELLISPTGVLK